MEEESLTAKTALSPVAARPRLGVWLGGADLVTSPFSNAASDSASQRLAPVASLSLSCNHRVGQEYFALGLFQTGTPGSSLQLHFNNL